MTPGQLIKKHREKIGMTQLELARELGYEIPQFISIVEHGRSKVPLDKCKKISEVLNIKPSIFQTSIKAEFAKEILKLWK